MTDSKVKFIKDASYSKLHLLNILHTRKRYILADARLQIGECIIEIVAP